MATVKNGDGNNNNNINSGKQRQQQNIATVHDTIVTANVRDACVKLLGLNIYGTVNDSDSKWRK